jgi:hypothetical protein
MAGICYEVGMDLARQCVYKDLIRIQSKKLSADKLEDKEAKQLGKLKEAHTDLKARNSLFTHAHTKCDKCEFRAETLSVLEHHREYGHGQQNPKNPIKCALCPLEFRGASLFIKHMSADHHRKGRQLTHPGFFSCPFCPYDNNSRANYTKHLPKCIKLFKIARNLEPTPADCDIPVTLPKTAQVMPSAKVAAPPKPVATKASVIAAKAPSGATSVAAVAKTAASNWVAAKASTVQSRLAAARQRSTPTTPVGVPRMPQGVVGARPAAPPSAASAAAAAGTPTQPQVMQVGNQWYSMINVNGQRFLTPFTGPPPTGTPPAVTPSASPATAAKTSPTAAPTAGQAMAAATEKHKEISQLIAGKKNAVPPPKKPVATPTPPASGAFEVRTSSTSTPLPPFTNTTVTYPNPLSLIVQPTPKSSFSLLSDQYPIF